MTKRLKKPLTVAFYLPQFHPIPENDGWYGAGFTEWTNVAQARPLFPGHYQPHIPGDLGFYDLRVPETRLQQARLAASHGIDAFCHYHYWFHGDRPLRRVLDELLELGLPDFPFCLAWANENWSRHWDASRHEVLLEQRYSPEDDEEHGRFLLRAMLHPKYLRLEGQPVLFIYRVQSLPDPARTITHWRELWRASGLEDVHVVKFDTHGLSDDPRPYGVDAAAQFFPHGVEGRVPPLNVPDAHPGNLIYSFEDVMQHALSQGQPEWRRYECVLPSWDNTPRRGDGKALVLHGSRPELYEEWLRAIHVRAGADGMVLINAWNEWAEGAHLEPDQRHGHAYLKATARAVGALPETPAPGQLEPAPEIRDMYAELYLDALEAQTKLQRRLSRLEATLERQVDAATTNARAEADRLREHALVLAAEVERLREAQGRATLVEGDRRGVPRRAIGGLRRPPRTPET